MQKGISPIEKICYSYPLASWKKRRGKKKGTPVPSWHKGKHRPQGPRSVHHHHLITETGFIKLSSNALINSIHYHWYVCHMLLCTTNRKRKPIRKNNEISLWSKSKLEVANSLLKLSQVNHQQERMNCSVNKISRGTYPDWINTVSKQQARINETIPFPYNDSSSEISHPENKTHDGMCWHWDKL